MLWRKSIWGRTVESDAAASTHASIPRFHGAAAALRSRPIQLPRAIALGRQSISRVDQRAILHREAQHAVIRGDFAHYFQTLHVVSFQSQCVVLGIPTVALRSVLEDRFSGLIRRILGDYLGYPITVHFVLHTPPPPTPTGVGEPARAQSAAPPVSSDPYADQSAALQRMLKDQLEPRQRGFVHDLQIVALTDTSITLVANNPIAQRWLTQHGESAVQTALAQLGWLGRQIELQVRGKSQ